MKFEIMKLTTNRTIRISGLTTKLTIFYSEKAFVGNFRFPIRGCFGSAEKITTKAFSFGEFMPSNGFRKENNNWKGGKVVASNGYVLIRVGIEHHLADVRGYAYEHRLVAEQKIGRKLQKGEIVHHIDHNKQNNHPDNLEVLTVAEHRYEHRTKTSNKKKPNEPNVLLSCACGCGAIFWKFDKCNRPRIFVNGHNMYRRNYV